MTFDQVLKIAEYAAPIIAGLLGAKMINQNSLPWHLWNGRIAKLLGLLITICDALRHPSKYINDVAPDDIKKKVDKIKNVSLVLLLLPGCASLQLQGDTWQDKGHTLISNLVSVTKGFQDVGMPIYQKVCLDLLDKCKEGQENQCEAATTCAKSYNEVLDILHEADDYLRLADVAISLGEKDKLDENIAKALTLVNTVVAKLIQYGAL